MKADSELQHAVRRFLAEGPDGQAGDVHVVVCDGVVTLTGKVSSDIASWRMEDAVRGMPGFDRLVNETMVVAAGTGDVADGDIARAWFPPG